MKLTRIIKYLILLSAVGLIITGVMTGEAAAVLSKATKICFECIGIG